MSYISSYLETLHNDVNLDEEISYDEEMYDYETFLKSAKVESTLKDEKAHEYFNTHAFKEKGDNTPLFTLSLDDVLKRRSSLMQNFTNSFAKVMRDKDKVMCFSTATVAPSDRLNNNGEKTYEETIKNQHTNFNSYYDHIRWDKKTRENEYFRTYELHKKGDLHSHSIDFIPDNISNVCDYIRVQKRAKKSKGIGRLELRLPYKHKKHIVKEFHLQSAGSNYFEDIKEFKKGYALIFTFFNPDKESAKDIVRYMMKYTSKNLAYSDKKSNEYYVFRKLGIRSYTYSYGVLPSLTAYQKIASQLIEKDERYKDLYELQKDIDKGILTFNTFYKTLEPEYQRRSIEKIDKIIKTPSYPVIYTYDSYHDICIFKGSCKLFYISVKFSDGTYLDWSNGNYETHHIKPTL